MRLKPSLVKFLHCQAIPPTISIPLTSLSQRFTRVSCDAWRLLAAIMAFGGCNVVGGPAGRTDWTQSVSPSKVWLPTQQ